MCFPLSGNAQLPKITDNLFDNKSKEEEALKRKSQDSIKHLDSLQILDLTQQLQQMKLNEILYLEELEKNRYAQFSDSLYKNRHIARIDSLRAVSKGAPVVVEDDTLFYFYASQGGVTYLHRALNTQKNIYEMGEKRSVKPDSIYLFPLEDGRQIEIMYGDRLVTSITNEDALWMNMPLDSLAKSNRDIIVSSVKNLQEKNSLTQLIKRISLFILVLAIQYFLWKGTNRLFRKFKNMIVRSEKIKPKPIVIRDYEILDAARQTRMIVSTASIFRYLLILIQLLITVPILFSIFPQTKDLAAKIFGYILTPVKSIISSIIDYIPNLFVIIVIWICIRYLIRGIRYIAKEIESNHLKISGFYPDWAMPTFNILKILLYAFMIAMIYPYLPGSQSGVFQGVSIFVGLIVSLGSSTVIGNIMSGLVMTYMRPFQIGDRIKMNDTVGNVVEKTLFVTRLKTPSNEIITIPNSNILSSHTTNYSASAREYGLIIHSNVSIGYDVPWQKAHELLIKAAKRTKDIIADKEPFILDFGLEDYYNIYQINIYITEADKMVIILTELHSHIQDVFAEEGINLESPQLVTHKQAFSEKKK